MQTANTTAADFIKAAASMPSPVCVTSFLTPQTLLSLEIYSNGSTVSKEVSESIVSVGVYMSDKSIWHICNFTNAANALNYAFMLKSSTQCPISKNAFALLQAEIKRTGAVSTRSQAAKAKAEESKAEAAAEAAAEVAPQDKPEDKAEAAPEEKPEVEVLKAPKPKRSKSITKTPLMKQYEEMKKKHPDAVLLFRVGDFYETFAEDAEIASEVLGITLTRRANGAKEYVRLAGFPHHALDTYLPKLVRAGHRVAICEQLENK